QHHCPLQSVSSPCRTYVPGPTNDAGRISRILGLCPFAVARSGGSQGGANGLFADPPLQSQSWPLGSTIVRRLSQSRRNAGPPHISTRGRHPLEYGNAPPTDTMT